MQKIQKLEAIIKASKNDLVKKLRKINFNKKTKHFNL